MLRGRWKAYLLVAALLPTAAGCWMDDPSWDDCSQSAPPYVGGPISYAQSAPASYGGAPTAAMAAGSGQTAEPPR